MNFCFLMLLTILWTCGRVTSSNDPPKTNLKLRLQKAFEKCDQHRQCLKDSDCGDNRHFCAGARVGVIFASVCGTCTEKRPSGMVVKRDVECRSGIMICHTCVLPVVNKLPLRSKCLDHDQCHSGYCSYAKYIAPRAPTRVDRKKLATKCLGECQEPKIEGQLSEHGHAASCKWGKQTCNHCLSKMTSIQGLGTSETLWDAKDMPEVIIPTIDENIMEVGEDLIATHLDFFHKHHGEVEQSVGLLGYFLIEGLPCSSDSECAPHLYCQHAGMVSPCKGICAACPSECSMAGCHYPGLKQRSEDELRCGRMEFWDKMKQTVKETLHESFIQQAKIIQCLVPRPKLPWNLMGLGGVSLPGDLSGIPDLDLNVENPLEGIGVEFNILADIPPIPNVLGDIEVVLPMISLVGIQWLNPGVVDLPNLPDLPPQLLADFALDVQGITIPEVKAGRCLVAIRDKSDVSSWKAPRPLRFHIKVPGKECLRFAKAWKFPTTSGEFDGTNILDDLDPEFYLSMGYDIKSLITFTGMGYMQLRVLPTPREFMAGFIDPKITFNTKVEITVKAGTSSRTDRIPLTSPYSVINQFVMVGPVPVFFALTIQPILRMHYSADVDGDVKVVFKASASLERQIGRKVLQWISYIYGEDKGPSQTQQVVHPEDGGLSKLERLAKNWIFQIHQKELILDSINVKSSVSVEAFLGVDISLLVEGVTLRVTLGAALFGSIAATVSEDNSCKPHELEVKAEAAMKLRCDVELSVDVVSQIAALAEVDFSHYTENVPTALDRRAIKDAISEMNEQMMSDEREEDAANNAEVEQRRAEECGEDPSRCSDLDVHDEDDMEDLNVGPREDVGPKEAPKPNIASRAIAEVRERSEIEVYRPDIKFLDLFAAANDLCKWALAKMKKALPTGALAEKMQQCAELDINDVCARGLSLLKQRLWGWSGTIPIAIRAFMVKTRFTVFNFPPVNLCKDVGLLLEGIGSKSEDEKQLEPFRPLHELPRDPPPPNGMPPQLQRDALLPPLQVPPQWQKKMEQERKSPSKKQSETLKLPPIERRIAASFNESWESILPLVLFSICVLFSIYAFTSEPSGDNYTALLEHDQQMI